VGHADALERHQNQKRQAAEGRDAEDHQCPQDPGEPAPMLSSPGTSGNGYGPRMTCWRPGRHRADRGQGGAREDRPDVPPEVGVVGRSGPERVLSVAWCPRGRQPGRAAADRAQSASVSPL
jgi:hypothetical protein